MTVPVLASGTYFVAGTDTAVGKTHWSVALLRAAARSGLRAVGLKPIAAGATRTAAGWRNDDALALQAASSVALPYETVNPICLPLAASPHVAARAAGLEIRVQWLANQIRLSAQQADLCLVEGAGGWLAPISLRETMADVAIALGAPVLLVVGLRLGCLNHALLTAEAIDRSGLALAGWIANEIADDHGGQAAQVELLSRRFGGPPFATGSRLIP